MSKIAVIVGSSRGIGLALTKRLSESGKYKVYGTVRKLTEEVEEKLKGVNVIDNVDIALDESKEVLIKGIKEPKIDLLVVNAGIGSNWAKNKSIMDQTEEDMLRLFQVNTIGPMHVVQALFGKIQEGTSVILVSSRVGSIADNGSGGFVDYRISKAALNMMATNLKNELGPKGVQVMPVHPGMIQTDMTGNNGTPVEECIDGFVKRIDEIESGKYENGSFVHLLTGEILPW